MEIRRPVALSTAAKVLIVGLPRVKLFSSLYSQINATQYPNFRNNFPKFTLASAHD